MNQLGQNGIDRGAVDQRRPPLAEGGFHGVENAAAVLHVRREPLIVFPAGLKADRIRDRRDDVQRFVDDVGRLVDRSTDVAHDRACFPSAGAGRRASRQSSA